MIRNMAIHQRATQISIKPQPPRRGASYESLWWISSLNYFSLMIRKTARKWSAGEAALLRCKRGRVQCERVFQTEGKAWAKALWKKSTWCIGGSEEVHHCCRKEGKGREGASGTMDPMRLKRNEGQTGQAWKSRPPWWVFTWSHENVFSRQCNVMSSMFWNVPCDYNMKTGKEWGQVGTGGSFRKLL